MPDNLLILPNIINYIRLAILLAAIPFNRYYFIALYVTSSSLDIVDGLIARAMNRCTLLGACLDMFTDRLSTVVIVCKIIAGGRHKPASDGARYGKRAGGVFASIGSNVLVFLLVIDMLSHMFMFTSSVHTATSHKQQTSFLLRLYYSRPLLVTLCAGTELYYVLLYVSRYLRVNGVVVDVCGSVMVVKALFHVVQMVEGIVRLSML